MTPVAIVTIVTIVTIVAKSVCLDSKYTCNHENTCYHSNQLIKMVCLTDSLLAKMAYYLEVLAQALSDSYISPFIPYSRKIWWALNLAKWLYFDIGEI